MRAKVALRTLLASSVLVGCSSLPRDQLIKGEGAEQVPTCVEVQKSDASVQRRCFTTKAAYLVWKACVERTGNRVKCYVGKRPAVVVPEEDHFRFTYAFVNISPATADAVGSVRDLRNLIATANATTCVFSAEGLSEIRPDLKVDPSGAAHSLTFDVTGSSGRCSVRDAFAAELKFKNIPLPSRIAGIGLLELVSPKPVVYFDRFRSVMPYYAYERPQGSEPNGGPLYAYMDFDSFSNDLAVGAFGFLATSNRSEDYLVVIDGSFRLSNGR